MSNHTDLLIAALCIVAAVAIGVAGILIDRPEKPRKSAPAGQHSRRGQRRAARAAQRSEDDQTIAWLAGLKRRVPALAIGRARVAGLLAVLPASRATEPPCPRYEAPDAGWMTAPGPWDTGEARAELVPLPPVPAGLGDIAARYADLFDRHGPHPRPAELTVVDLIVVDPPPNARAGYWQPRAGLPAPKFTDPDLCSGCLAGAHCDGGASFCECTCGLPADWAERGALAVPDWDPVIDGPGLVHLRYPWADQVAADFDWAEVSRG